MSSLALAKNGGLQSVLKGGSQVSQVLLQARWVSSSPYGRTHVWKHRQKKLPKPFVPQFPQRVIRADGSTFTHYTTSPRSVIRLTRDTTNNPLWNAFTWRGDSAEEDQVTGRLGRFNRKFDGMGGHGQEIDWMSNAVDSTPKDTAKPKKNES